MGQKARFYVEVRTLNSRVTGSCYVCKIAFSDGTKKFFLVDCGMFQERENQEYNERLTFNPEDVCFTVLTHNHTDHVGRVPLLYRRGCTAKLYSSIGTAMALPINFEDTLRILQERAKLARKNSQKFQNSKDNGQPRGRKRKVCCCDEFDIPEQMHVSFSPLFGVNDVKEALEHLHPVPFGKWITDPKLPQVRFKLYPNAHLPGAAMILVEVSDVNLGQKMNLLFLGDWNTQNIFQGSFDFPKELRDIPLHVITESTYGSTYKSEIKRCLRDNIIQAVKEEKVVLLPVISQFRAQEMLWYIKNLQDYGDIPKSTPVFFCGPLGLKYAHLYSSDEFPCLNSKMKDFFPDNLEVVSISGNCNLSEIQQAIYIVTGGMGSNGPSTAYLRALLPCPNVLVHFSSYCAEDTLGRKLKENETEGQTTVKISGMEVEVVAEVKFTSELSGHAKADELLDFLSGFKKIKALLVAHGEVEAKQQFASLVEDANIAKEVTILDREHYVRLNPWGILENKVWQE